MQIESLQITSPFVLAPLAGYCNLPFRVLCLEYGAGLVYSEMISCHGLVYRQKKTFEMLKTAAEDHPVAMQLFGADPEIMGEAAAIVGETDTDIIDINMGCPVKKVVKKGGGAALMKNPHLAARIIRSVVEKGGKPVTVKIRSGWNHERINGIDFARMAEDNGASALAVHGRTWSDGFGGQANWAYIARIKEKVTIPVIGNGDITSRDEGWQRMEESGCDGVMIGRAAMGRPWIFEDNVDGNGLAVRLRTLKRHLELIKTHADPHRGAAALRSQAGRYFKGIPHGNKIREQIFRTSSFEELENVLSSLQSE